MVIKLFIVTFSAVERPQDKLELISIDWHQKRTFWTFCCHNTELRLLLLLCVW